MNSRLSMGVLAAGLALALAGCSEKPQAVSARKADGKAWEISPNGYIAQGWKPGDQASWQQQIEQRAQSQNEYLRVPASR